MLALIFGISHASFAQNEITFLAPRPVQGPIEKLIKEFEAKTNYKVNAVWDSGLGTKKLVAEGKYQDVSVMFSPFPEALASGNLDKNSAAVLMRLTMAVAVKKGAPKPDISTPSAVKRMLLNAKSIAYPDPEGGTGASGVNVIMMLRRLGIEDAVKAKTTLTRGGGRAMAMAASGEAEIGMTYYIGMYGNDKIDIVGTLPAQIAPPTPLIGFISSKSKNPAAAKELLTFLTSPEASATYKKYLLEPAY